MWVTLCFDRHIYNFVSVLFTGQINNITISHQCQNIEAKLRLLQLHFLYQVFSFLAKGKYVY